MIRRGPNEFPRKFFALAFGEKSLCLIDFMHLRSHLRLHPGAALQQHLLHRIIFVIPCIA
jgi:hypothetical protein